MRRRSAKLTFAAITLLISAGSGRGESLSELRAQQVKLIGTLAELAVETPYIVIDTQDNELTLRDQNHAELRRTVCATGSGRRLEGRDPRKKRHRWEFSTPTGRFSVLRKVANPIWTKPEWYFVEVDEEIPVFAEDWRRFQRGVLGEYALYFAKDYMIHGTPFEINLGKSITHGCVRVDSESLVYLHDTVEVGWPVYIY